jgi:Flp pilus assembly protein TadG
MTRIQDIFRRAARDESGAIFLFILVLLVVIFGMAALAVDLGRGYVVHMRLARAVDAGTLAGARSIRLGQATAHAEALRVAELNGADAMAGVDINVVFGTNELGEHTINMTASTEVPTVFAKVIGFDEIPVGVSAAAAVPPVDMVLVLDQSGSLGTENAWDDLQQAAKSFIRHFNDRLDMVGLVSFQLRATDRFHIDHDFTNPIVQVIDVMTSDGDTNTGEGLRLAYQQMNDPALRQSSVKVVVFFTDGRPTALRGVVGPEPDRMIAVSTRVTGRVRGYFDDPDSLPSDGLVSPDGCVRVPDCYGWLESTVRTQGRQNGIDMADLIRSNDVLIHTIGLGNPNNPNPILQPDLDYLRLLANEAGVASSSQPKGRSYFAPSATELEAVFDQVAQDLLVHLTR